MATVQEIRNAHKELGRAKGVEERYHAETKLIKLLLAAIQDPSLANLHNRFRFDLERLLRRDVE
jgi:hypothetical protein